mgnify:CR=1 FL=1
MKQKREQELQIEIKDLENRVEELMDEIDLLKTENTDLQHQIDEFDARD